jgi:hypothetical protein
MGTLDVFAVAVDGYIAGVAASYYWVHMLWILGRFS